MPERERERKTEIGRKTDKSRAYLDTQNKLNVFVNYEKFKI